MNSLSVILPCYNEEGNLETILTRYRGLTGKLALELILVDNGSTDGTPRILAEALQRPENQFARSVRVAKNVGYGHGLQAGLKEAKGGVLAFSHADLQCSPEDLIVAYDLYLRYAVQGACLIKGRRIGARARADRAVTWVYNHLASWLLGISALTHDSAKGLSRPHVTDINAQPKLFSRHLLDDLLRGPTDFTFDLFVLATAQRRNARLIEFPVEYLTRAWGRSKLAANPWVRLLTSLKAFRYILTLRLWKPQ